MRVLAIETSALVGTVALCEADRCVARAEFSGTRNHAAELAPTVRALLAEHGGLEAVGGYAISIGPGSFTGLRIGVAFVKGLAAVCPRPAVAVSSLRIIAVQALALRPDTPCWAILDARRGEVFAGLYDRAGQADPRVSDGLYMAAELKGRAANLPGSSEWMAVGDDVGALPDGLFWAPSSAATPMAETVGRLAWVPLVAGEGIDAGRLDPAYMQRSGAEVTLGVDAPESMPLHLEPDA